MTSEVGGCGGGPILRAQQQPFVFLRPEERPPHARGSLSPHQFSLLMWSPKPGVSMTVSFMRTPFSSMSARVTAPAELRAGPGPDSPRGWARLPGQPRPNEAHSGCPRVTSDDALVYSRDTRAATAEVQQGLVALTPVISGGQLSCVSLSELRGGPVAGPSPGPTASTPSGVAARPRPRAPAGAHRA